MERLRENIAVSLPSMSHLTDDAAVEASEAAASPAHQTAAPALRTVGQDGPQSSAAAVSTDCSAAWDGVTTVRVDDLDWRQSANQLQPPYDVVLVADVVSYHDGYAFAQHHRLIPSHDVQASCAFD